MNCNLRLYTFTNFYLNSISQGIQPAHVIGRMSKRMRFEDTPQADLFWEWLTEGQDNETMICLNGGMAADVVEAYEKFKDCLHEQGLPSGIFYEEPRALGAEGSTPAPTSWGVVLTERIYNAKYVRDYPHHYGPGPAFCEVDELGVIGKVIATPGFPLFDFLEYKSRCGMAR
jgi:hypothetical protein